MSRRRVVLGFILAAALPSLVGNASAQSVTDPSVVSTAADCAARLRAAAGEPDSAGNVPRLADVCPNLALELQSGAWAPTLGAVRADDLTSRQFEELVDLIEDYERAPREAALAVEQLAAFVEALPPFEPVAEVSLWDQIREWIRNRLGFDDPDRNGGLIEWLRNLSIPEEWVRTIVYVLGVSIVIAALVVFVNELRVSGMLGGDQSRAQLRATTSILPAWAKRLPLTFEGVRRAPPARQPALLLSMLVERLQARFGDAVRASLTHRELAAAAGKLGVRHQRELEAVAAAAERVTFAGWRPEREDVEPVIAQGHAVLAELEGQTGSRSGSET